MGIIRNTPSSASIGSRQRSGPLYKRPNTHQSLLPPASTERKDHAGPLVAEHAAMTPQQVLAELAIVFEPPEGGPRNDEVVRASRPHGLQLRDRCVAVRRVMARVDAATGLREMPPMPPVECQQLVVAAADDGEGRVTRHFPLNHRAKAADEPAVPRLLDAAKQRLHLARSRHYAIAEVLKR